jgi:uncharacterized protein with FMN-binding domain
VYLRRKLISLLLSLVAAVPFTGALLVSGNGSQASAATPKTAKSVHATQTAIARKKAAKKKAIKKKKTTRKKKTVKKATPKPTAKPKPTPRPTATATQGTASGTFDGPQIQSRFGPVQVTVVVQNGQITDVKVSNAPDTARSTIIQGQAVPLLKQEALKATSGNIHLISGATITSRAFEQSFQGALTRANT